jgi:hypothetical protein
MAMDLAMGPQAPCYLRYTTLLGLSLACLCVGRLNGMADEWLACVVL